MTAYFVDGKGWRYHFQIRKKRHTGSWFGTKREALAAEAERRKELKTGRTRTDIKLLDLVNLRLDYVKEYNSDRHYQDLKYMARRWVREWNGLDAGTITTEMVELYLIRRKRETSSQTANSDLRNIRALFNFALHPSREWLEKNPTRGIAFFPVSKNQKYVPPREQVLKVLDQANEDTADYLWTIALTLGRMSEINNLQWTDIDLTNRYLILYTRKKRGGHRTPRKIYMCDKLQAIMERRAGKIQEDTPPWVFWHRYWSRKARKFVKGPYAERKKIMGTLCKKASVPYFRFHALRHFGASMLEQAGVPIGSIQRILGHENRQTTEIYLHSIHEAECNAMNVLGTEFNK